MEHKKVNKNSSRSEAEIEGADIQPVDTPVHSVSIEHKWVQATALRRKIGCSVDDSLSAR